MRIPVILISFLLMSTPALAHHESHEPDFENKKIVIDFPKKENEDKNFWGWKLIRVDEHVAIGLRQDDKILIPTIKITVKF